MQADVVGAGLRRAEFRVLARLQLVGEPLADHTGKQAVGAPNLTDAIWLYGSDIASVVATISNPRNGVMPAWADRLDKVTIKALALYVHSLGGGK